MEIQELKEKIIQWELDNQESFIDYFMHDKVKDGSWAFWLLGKGYSERANVIIDLLVSKKTLDQALLYQVNSALVVENYGDDEPFNKFNYYKDIELCAEFLLSNKYYKNKIIDFINNENKRY